MSGTDTLVFIGLVLLTSIILRLIWLSMRDSDITEKLGYLWRSPFVRSHKNPLLGPVGHHEWENHSVFNPAAVYLGGRIHLLYRAIGGDGVSRVGYASSRDGFHFNERTIYPIFELTTNRPCFPSLRKYSPILYPSGGSWGGCEDPRITHLEDRAYLTFNAFDGWDFIRIGAVHLHERDFLKKFWKWSSPLLISPPGEIHKNWVLFPEKIGGKFAILHSITPEIQIDFVDRLEDLAHGACTVKSRFSKQPRDSWDTWLRGVGPPPIKTDKGWLVLYHAIEAKEPDRYKIGAMLLDSNDPKKVIAIAKGPLLAPETHYENNWKPGVVYTCGAVVKDGTLFIYYGGGDQTISVATAPLQEVLGGILGGTIVDFDKTSIRA